MNVSASPLPAQAGINFCEIDGAPFFRVIDLAQQFFPDKTPGFDLLHARTAARLLEDKKRPVVANVTKGADRRGHYLPAGEMEEAVELFQDPAVRREISSRSGGIIGSIMKEKRTKAAMTTTEPTTTVINPEFAKLFKAPEPGLLITAIADMIFRPKTGTGGSIASVPSILVEAGATLPFVLVLRGGTVFIEALTIAKIIASGVSETTHYEAIRGTGRLLINCRRSSGGRPHRFIAIDHIDALAELLLSPRFSFEREHVANIKNLIAQALDAWPAAHSKTAVPVPAVEPVTSEPTVIEPAGEVSERAQKLMNAIEDLQKNSLTQSAAINAQRGIIDRQTIAIDKLTAVINAQTRALTILAEREADRATSRHQDVMGAIEGNAPKAARPLLGRLFGNA